MFYYMSGRPMCVKFGSATPTKSYSNVLPIKRFPDEHNTKTEAQYPVW